jgi:integrase
MTTPATILNKPAIIFEPKQLQLAVETVMLLQKFENDQRLNGKAEETISRRMQQLYQVGELTDLNNPEAVKTWLNGINPNKGQKYCKWETTTKIKFCDTYTAFLTFQDKKWKAPKYVLNRKLPFIPTEQEIDLLIAGCGKTTATVLQTLKETGIRIGELCNLKWIDLNIESKTLNITPEKGSNPRVLPISEKLIGLLNKLSKQHSPNIFQPKKHMLREYFCIQRKELATRLK